MLPVMKTDLTTSPLEVIHLGTVPYSQGLAQQEARALALQQGSSPEALYLLEHDPPVITVGRNADRRHVLWSSHELSAAGIEVHDCSRGGDVTYHGPGQLVAYAVLDLARRQPPKDLGAYLRDLEEVIIRTLRHFDISGRRIPGLTGVWVGEPAAKIAAIGVHVSRWITTHGIALNVSPRLDHFATIVPCGLSEPVTSMEECVTQRRTPSDTPSQAVPTVDAVARRFADEFASVFG